MKRRREYVESLKIDQDTSTVRLIAVEDTSCNTTLRSQEVIELAAKMIRLASKRGPVTKLDKGDFDAAA